jgi:hypothetical protein
MIKAKVPVLATFAYPHALPADVTVDARIEREEDTEFIDQRAKLFRAQPDVKVVLLPHAAHGGQDCNRAEVIQEIDAFAAKVEN